MKGMADGNDANLTRHGFLLRCGFRPADPAAARRPARPDRLRPRPRGAGAARVTARVKTDEGAETAATLWRSFTEPDHDLRTRAAQISAPVLITWGARDLTAPKRWGKAVQAAIPGSTFEALPTGHVVFSSEQAERQAAV